MNIPWQTTTGNGFDKFLAHLQALKGQLGPALLSYKEHWLNQTALLNRLLPQQTTLLFVWDLTASDVVFLRHSFGGQSEGSLSAIADTTVIALLLSNIHQDYQPAALLFYHAMLDVFFQESVPATKRPTCHFNFLFQRRSGGYGQLLQQVVAIEADEMGRPLLLLCSSYDATYLLKEHTANFIVTTGYHQLFIWCYNFAQHHTEPVHPFTLQETKVLQALSEGMDTRDMAAALYTSPHTIDTHRRNLLRKTGCVDTTALITYLKMVGYAF